MRVPALPHARSGHRPRWLHHPALRWAIVVVASALAARTVQGELRAARRIRIEAVTTVDVAVARRPVPAGAALRPDDVALRPRPRPDVPEGALRAVPVGRRTTAPLVPGDVIVSARLAGADGGPLAAAIPAGRRAVTVPVEEGQQVDVRPGDRVDVLAAGVASARDPAGAAAVAALVAVAAPVITAGDASVTIAVTPGELPAMAAALADGPVLVAVLPG